MERPSAVDLSEVGASLTGYCADLVDALRTGLVKGQFTDCPDHPLRVHAQGLCIRLEVRGGVWVLKELSPSCPS